MLFLAAVRVKVDMAEGAAILLRPDTGYPEVYRGFSQCVQANT
jgi:hypothetical protein